MRKPAQRALTLLLCLAMLLPMLSGCAQLHIYQQFFTGTGTKDPAAGAVTPPTPPADLSALALSYDEQYTINGQFLMLDSVETKDLSLLDIEEAEDGRSFTLRARGIGTGRLAYLENGVEKSIPVTVRPARLAVFFLIGADDAHGSMVGDANILHAAEGSVYYTMPEYGSTSRVTPKTVADFLPYELAEPTLSQMGGELYYPLNELTSGGKNRCAGLAAPLAYKWVEQTGERVWIINLSKKDASILDLLPNAAVVPGGANEHEILSALAAGVFEVLRQEYAMGHFTHARTGWFLAQGERDRNMSASDYLAALTTLTTTMEDTLTFTAGETTYAPHFGGMIGSRSLRKNDLTIAEMSGPRTAQLVAAGMDGALQRLHLLAEMPSLWYSDAAVATYFSQYDRHKFLLYYGCEPPKAMSDLYTNQGELTAMAYNETAAVAVESLLHIEGLRNHDGASAEISLLSYGGIEKIGEQLVLSYGHDVAAAVPRVTPLYMTKTAAVRVTMETEGKSVDLCRVPGAADGDLIYLSYTSAIGQSKEIMLPIERIMRFAFSDYLPILITDPTNDRPAFGGFRQHFTCGYIDRASGAYTVFPGFEWRTGWLYDGKSLWQGHGGVCLTNKCHAGPLDNWDAGYAFTAPAAGKASIAFNGIYPGINEYLFAICVNGQPVWPTAAANPQSNASFYTVRKDSTLEEINAAVADLSLTLEKGDVITFTYRRIRNGVTAEGALHPVVTIR
jgi:hypothetical protein